VSIESMSIVLHHSRASGTAKLVLLGIANHDGDGGAWPSVDTLGRYANVSRSRVHAALKTLETLGEVRRMIGQGGDHSTADHMRPNLYHVTLHCPESCDRRKNHRSKHSQAMLAYPVSFPIPPIESDTGGVSVAIPEPSLNPTMETKRKNSSNRARENETCVKGHPIIGRSGGGTPFCSFGCPPLSVVSLATA
jgi:hypothetical protein